MRYQVIGALAIMAVLSTATPTTAQAPVSVPTTTRPATKVEVSNTLRALDKLRSYGYHWTTNAGALKAIKAWQRANGLTIDGEVGTETLASLNLPATAAATAVRLSPPAPATARSSEPGDVEAIIREVWPDDLEDNALRIVSRETGRTFDPTVRNACCYGLFQIHWTAHRAWLAQFGVTSASQLLDARTNTEVAYQLYLIDGWRPWNT